MVARKTLLVACQCLIINLYMSSLTDFLTVPVSFFSHRSLFFSSQIDISTFVEAHGGGQSPRKPSSGGGASGGGASGGDASEAGPSTVRKKVPLAQMELATFTMLSSTLLHQEFTHSTSSAGAGVGKEGSATAIPVCPNETPEADRVDYLGGDPAAEAAAAMGVDRTDASRGRGNHISMKLAAASRGKGAKRSGAKAKAKRAAQEKPVDLSKVSFVFSFIYSYIILLLPLTTTYFNR